MSIPNDVRTLLRERVWIAAEHIGWQALTNLERSRFYDQWTDAPEIGGLLQHYIDPSQVRVYIKDTLLKGYSQARLNDPARVLRILRISPTIQIERVYRKPHGLLLFDGRVIAWGRADDWRVILMSVYERAYAQPALYPHAAVLLNASGRFDAIKPVAEDLATRLEVANTVWID